MNTYQNLLFRHSRYLHVLRVIRTCYEHVIPVSFKPKNNDHIREINININSRNESSQT